MGRKHVTAAAAAASAAAAAALCLCYCSSCLQLLQQEIIDETDLYVDNMQVRGSPMH
jgi:mevalonate pyrophosphate decarboxylase